VKKKQSGFLWVVQKSLRASEERVFVKKIEDFGPKCSKSDWCHDCQNVRILFDMIVETCPNPSKS